MNSRRISTWPDGPDLGQTQADGSQGEQAAAIAVIDDDDAVRGSTARLVESEGYRVLQFASGDEFLRSGSPDGLTCVVLDICMPGRTGLEVLRELARRGAVPPVIVLTGRADIAMAVQAMKLRAFDLMEKPCEPAALLRVVARARLVATDLLAARQARLEAAAMVARLTERQQQVLRLIVDGDPNKIIAWKLGLSVRTVEAYRAQLLERLRVRTTVEAVRIAISAGIGNHPQPIAITR